MNSPFDTQNPVIPPIFAGRKKELEELKRCIIDSNQSVSISGYHGIGKSSLILTMFEMIKGVKQKHLPVHIDERSFRRILNGDFLRLVTHEICAAMWSDIFQGKYSELLEESMMVTMGSVVENKHKRTLKRIFRIATSQSVVAGGKKGGDISAKMVVGGKLEESNTLNITRRPLEPFEFFLLLDELMEILEDHGFERVIVVCDQLNHLPRSDDFDAVAHNLEVLASKKIMFLVSAFRKEAYKDMGIDASSLDHLLRSFSTCIELNAFNSNSEVSEFLSNSLVNSNLEVEIEDACISTALNLTEGVPFFLAHLFSRVFKEVNQRGLKTIKLSDIEKHNVLFAKALTHYNSDGGLLMRNTNPIFLIDNNR